jgi:hypothetical protein
MVNNSTNINKPTNNTSPQIIEHNNFKKTAKYTLEIYTVLSWRYEFSIVIYSR